MNINNSEQWYIVKAQNNTCQIILAENRPTQDTKKVWGPFISQQEAIARRVGLIRAGKCQPI